MYTLYHNGDALFDPRLDGYPLQAPTLTLEANKFGTLEFTIFPGNPEYGQIERLTSTIAVYKDDALCGLYRPTYSKKLFKGGVLFRCKEIIFRLNEFIYRPLTYTGTIDGFITAILASYNARVGASEQFTKGTVSGGSAAFAFSESKPLGHWDALQKIVDANGGYFYATYTASNMTLNYSQEADLPASAQSIVFGENMTDLFIETETDSTFSVLYPVGRDGTSTITISSVNGGVDYLESSAGIALYGRRETCITWENVQSASQLKTLAQAKLDEIAVKFAETVQIKAVDLHNADINVSALSFLSRVDCVSAPHGLSHTYVLGRMKIPLGSPDASDIQLGVKRQTLTDKITLEKRETDAQISSVKTSIAAETERAKDAEITSIVKEYALGTSGINAPSTGWSETFPEPDATNTYVWSRIVTVDGTGTHYSTPTVEAGYRTISQAAITAANIANGSTAVPRVTSTGIDINGNKLSVSSTGEIEMLGNSKVYFGTSSSNSAVVLDKDGLALGSGKSVAIASGGKISMESGSDLEIKAGSDLEIKSGGSFKLTTSDILIDTASGKLEMYSSGNKFLDCGAGRVQIHDLDIYSNFESAYTGVTEILAALEWYGWIRKASVSGNTLTLTKSDGNTVAFTPSGGGSSPIYSHPDTTCAGTPSDCLYNADTNRFTIYFGSNGDNYSVTIQG